MMNYHIVLSKSCDLKEFNEGAKQGKNPRHLMWDLAQKLDAKVHSPGNESITYVDRIMAKIFGALPEQVAMVRKIVSQLQNEDVVFCNGSDVGFPLAVLCKFVGKRPKLMTNVMVPDNKRVQLLLKVFALETQIDVFLLDAPDKAEFLQSFLSLSVDRVCSLPLSTDTDFFSPGPKSPGKTRPLIASAGLEQRDYITLAAATQDLDVDVKICAASCAANAAGSGFPEVLPANMEARFYPWGEFRQLYRDADLVVVPLMDHSYSAGTTVALEAMACRKPVILTCTSGANQEFCDQGVVMGVPVGDVVSLRQAIVALLDNPQEAAALAKRGHEKVLWEHTSDHSLQLLVSELRKLAVVTSQEGVTVAV